MVQISSTDTHVIQTLCVLFTLILHRKARFMLLERCCVTRLIPPITLQLTSSNKPTIKTAWRKRFCIHCRKTLAKTFWQPRSQGHSQIEQLGFVHTIFFCKILQTFKSHANGNALTHPDFSKLPSSEPAFQFQRLTRNLPLVLPPGFLRCPRLTWFHQLCAQPVCIT